MRVSQFVTERLNKFKQISLQTELVKNIVLPFSINSHCFRLQKSTVSIDNKFYFILNLFALPDFHDV